MTQEAKRITATELARSLSDILSRVKYRGETFVVERNGEPIATLQPPALVQGKPLKDILAQIGDIPLPDPGFAEDVEEGIRLHNQPW